MTLCEKMSKHNISEIGYVNGIYKHIINVCGKMLGYKNATLSTYPNSDYDFVSICLGANDKPNTYLNFMVVKSENGYIVNQVLGIIGKFELFELTEDEKNVLLSSEVKLYEYNDAYFSCIPLPNDFESIAKLFSPQTEMKNIVIDRASRCRLKKVSEFLSDYVDLNKELAAYQGNLEGYEILKKFASLECSILEPIARNCKTLLGAKMHSIRTKRIDSGVCATIFIGNSNSDFKTLTLFIQNMLNPTISYGRQVTPQQYALYELPESISDIVMLF
jgi:hypothetical protein